MVSVRRKTTLCSWGAVPPHWPAVSAERSASCLGVKLGSRSPWLRCTILPAGISAKELQDIVVETGKANGYVKETLRSWYQAIYEVLLGSSEGPRFGPFIELYGIPETRTLIERGLKGEFLKAA